MNKYFTTAHTDSSFIFPTPTSNTWTTPTNERISNSPTFPSCSVPPWSKPHHPSLESLPTSLPASFLFIYILCSKQQSKRSPRMLPASNGFNFSGFLWQSPNYDLLGHIGFNQSVPTASASSGTVPPHPWRSSPLKAFRFVWPPQGGSDLKSSHWLLSAQAALVLCHCPVGPSRRSCTCLTIILSEKSSLLASLNGSTLSATCSVTPWHHYFSQFSASFEFVYSFTSLFSAPPY